jgi:hypothetical protein
MSTASSAVSSELASYRRSTTIGLVSTLGYLEDLPDKLYILSQQVPSLASPLLVLSLKLEPWFELSLIVPSF